MTGRFLRAEACPICRSREIRPWKKGTFDYAALSADQIKITVEENTKLTVEGPSKQMVGQVAAEIRSYYPPEPYKGKGIRYVGEKVIRKVGKTVQQYKRKLWVLAAEGQAGPTTVFTAVNMECPP